MKTNIGTDNVEDFDSTGWTFIGGWDCTDSDAGMFGATLVVDGVNMGFTEFTIVEGDEDDPESEHRELWGK